MSPTASQLDELSFVGTEPLPSLPYLRHRVRLAAASDRGELPRDLGRLAARLKGSTRQPVLSDPYASALVAPADLPLRGGDGWEILASEPLDLRDRRYDRLLFQACHYWFLARFQARNPPPLVDPFRKRIYAREPQTLRSSSGPLIARRYLTFEFARLPAASPEDNPPDRLLLALDFASEYRVRDTLDRRDLADLQPGQRLVHRYDGKSCEFVGPATETAGTPLAVLGNRSALDYHRERGHLPADRAAQIPPETPLLQIRYPGDREPCLHLPHLLQELYDPGKLDRAAFDAQLLPIDEKFHLAIATLKNFQRWPRPAGDFLDFQTQPRSAPAPQQLDGRDVQNLDFGPNPQRPETRLYVGYPTAGVANGRLLEKPDAINAAILFPEPWRDRADRYSDRLKQAFEGYGIDLRRAATPYDPLDPVSLRTVSDRLNPATELAIACVPSSADRLYRRDIDPYRTLKRELGRRRLPSQMVTEKILNRADPYVDRNVLLGAIAKLGYRAWQLREMPGTADAFLGLDIGRKDDQAIGSAAFAIGRRGEWLGWGSVATTARGETFDGDSLHDLLVTLAARHQTHFGRPLAHLVVHRDGLVQREELDALQRVAERLAPDGLARLDVVEIVKDCVCRAGWRQEVRPEALPATQSPATQSPATKTPETNTTWTNPTKGWLWERTPEEMLLLSTGSKEAKVHQNAAPRPLKIRRRAGETDLKTLAAQVYWLANLHLGTTQTVRLPATIYYADRAATAALDGLAPPGFQDAPQLWFL